MNGSSIPLTHKMYWKCMSHGSHVILGNFWLWNIKQFLKLTRSDFKEVDVELKIFWHQRKQHRLVQFSQKPHNQLIFSWNPTKLMSLVVWLLWLLLFKNEHWHVYSSQQTCLCCCCASMIYLWNKHILLS